MLNSEIKNGRYINVDIYAILNSAEKNNNVFAG